MCLTVVYDGTQKKVTTIKKLFRTAYLIKWNELNKNIEKKNNLMCVMLRLECAWWGSIRNHKWKVSSRSLFNLFFFHAFKETTRVK